MKNLNLNVVIVRIPRRCFEIEGEAFMISHEEEEPKTI